MSSFGAISFSGLASGLDTASIVRALVAAERRPIDALESRRASLDGRRDLFGRATSLLSSLRDAADALRSGDAFGALAAGTSRDDFLTARTTTGATAGSWQVVVERLAAAQVNQSDGVADPAAAIGSGTLTVQVGNRSTDVPLSGASLDDIAAAINGIDGIGVSAEVVDTGIGATPHRLVVRADEPGSQGFKITATGDAALQAFATTTNANTVQAGQNARLLVDGIAIERATNTITDAIDGVTLDLVAADANATTVVTVDTDADAVTDKVRALVDAYNAWRGFVADQTRFDGDTRGALLGDSLVRGISDGLRGIVGNAVDTGDPATALLEQVGIGSATDGKLELDAAEFAARLAADPDAVAALFAGTNGVATTLHARLEADLDSADGSLAIRRDSLDDRIATLDSSIRRSERRLDQMTGRLEARFAALETALARLQAQGNALAGLGFFSS